jgi:hypothetical protein
MRSIRPQAGLRKPRTKFMPRAAFAALTAISAASALLLPGASPALASPVPPAPDPALFGTWVNTNPAAAHILDIVISKGGSGLLVDLFPNCPSCEEGNVPATVYGTGVNSTTGSTFQVNTIHFDSSGSENGVVLGTLTSQGGKPMLRVQEFATVFQLGEADNVDSEMFMLAAPLTPQATGTAATNYPAGNWVAPAPSLFGTWQSTTPGDKGLTTIVITANASGPPSVHVFGTCNPNPCDWGVTPTITYATSLFGNTAMTFLASYKMGFKNALLSGTVSSDGSTLTVSTYSEFTDGTDRSNYVLNETFVRN